MTKIGLYATPLSSQADSRFSLKPYRFFQQIIGAALVASVSLQSLFMPAHADARLNAPTAAGTRVNSDPESLLRYGLPINSKEIRDIQGAIESARMNLKTRRTNFALSDMNNAKSLLKKNEATILAQVPLEHKKQASESINRLKDDFIPVLEAIQAEGSSSSGSIQERKSKPFSSYALSFYPHCLYRSR